MLDETSAALGNHLNVLTIRVPPLRERPEDVAVQARHFLGRAQAGREQGVADFSTRVVEVLTRLRGEGTAGSWRTASGRSWPTRKICRAGCWSWVPAWPRRRRERAH